MRLDPGTMTSGDLARRFDDVADRFSGADYVHRTTCGGLIERLAPVEIEPRLVVDLGSATGEGGRALAGTWRRATIVSLDLSTRMLDAAKRARPLFGRRRFAPVRADARHMPFPTGSVDLVFANMLLPWLDDPGSCFAEVARILAKGGVFAFATLGPDSFSGLRGLVPLHDYPDMHDLGDALVRAGLADPVLDIDRLCLTFGRTAALAADLVACGARRGAPEQLEQELTGGRADREWSLGLELVYGHAWGVGVRPAPGEFRVEAGSIPHREKR